MGIRLPLKTVGTFSPSANETGGGSVSGGFAHAFVLPQDTDNVVVKFTASVVGAYSAVLQTSDDGGTTYYDVARTSIVSNANNAVTAEWLSCPVVGVGVKSTVVVASTVATGSVFSFGSINGTIGRAGASTLGQLENSGLPILSQYGRVFVRITGNITDADANTYVAKVMVNSQSATA